jgi:hypothetical protein
MYGSSFFFLFGFSIQLITTGKATASKAEIVTDTWIQMSLCARFGYVMSVLFGLE